MINEKKDTKLRFHVFFIFNYYSYFNANNIVPLIINTAPIAVFTVSVSLKNTTAKMMAMATLNLSTAAT